MARGVSGKGRADRGIPVAVPPRELGFVHLHVHSSFSLLEGSLTIAALNKLALADNQPAVALTDTNNLFGALEFSEKMAASGIQPIVGVQLSIDFQDEDSAGPRALPELCTRLARAPLNATDAFSPG